MTISFPGLNNAPIFDKGNFMDPGTYDLEITNIIAKRTHAKGDAFIVEFKVLNAYGHPKHRAGDKVSYFQKLIDPSVALPAIKAFLVAALGYDWKTQRTEVEEKVAPQLEQILNEAITKGALNGTKVHDSVFQKKTKAGKDFSVHDWTPYKEAV